MLQIKCDYCGRFISYNDIDNNKAVYKMIQPDSEFGPETWTSYHKECKEKEEGKKSSATNNNK